MKKIASLLSVFLLLPLSKAAAQFDGTIGTGAHVGYGSGINSPGSGVHIHYYYANNIRFAPSFTHFLERKGESMWMIDTDAHFIIPISLSSSLYPVTGVHFSNWKHEATIKGDILTEGRSDHRIGINLGGGFQHDIGYKIRANFELKYQFIQNYSQAVFTAGIGFWF
ncbi:MULTISPECIES: hypothetical protein [Proteiniphilum]|jgi:hypothetical protein|uniref:hypothetical protein n=1 Tax=Proteiniphilum TaxID=294702 RepID=UPI001EEA5699|nr:MULTISPECIES: hypothetical protein [Proteiniphilum]ULB35335.1 hypothetical protein KDN43_04665 [Proteiniphilum propionicum]